MPEQTAPTGRYIALHSLLFGESHLEEGDVIPFEEGRDYDAMVRLKQARFEPNYNGHTELEAKLLEKVSDLTAQSEVLQNTNTTLQTALDEAGIVVTIPEEEKAAEIAPSSEEANPDLLTATAPGFYALKTAEITTWSALEGKSLDELTAIKGIGEPTAKKLLEMIETRKAE